jgi:hypothetical protein
MNELKIPDDVKPWRKIMAAGLLAGSDKEAAALFDQAIDRIARLESDAAISNEIDEALGQKFDGCPHNHDTCACSWDAPGDVCSVHAPALRKAVAELTEANRKIERLSASVSDAEWDGRKFMTRGAIDALVAARAAGKEPTNGNV